MDRTKPNIIGSFNQNEYKLLKEKTLPENCSIKIYKKCDEQSYKLVYCAGKNIVKVEDLTVSEAEVWFCNNVHNCSI